MKITSLLSLVFLLLITIQSTASTELDSIPYGKRDSLQHSLDKWAFSVALRTSEEFYRIIQDNKEIIRRQQLQLESCDMEADKLMAGIYSITNAYEIQSARIPKLEKEISRWKGVSLSIGVAALTYVIINEVKK